VFPVGCFPEIPAAIGVALEGRPNRLVSSWWFSRREMHDAEPE